MQASRVGVFLATALLLGGCRTAAAQCDQVAGASTGAVRGELADSLDRLLSQEAERGFSGAVLVARGGDIVLHRGYGCADRERGIPVTTETVFDIGSIPKSFTAAAILALSDEGKLNTRDPLTRYFADVPADKRAITVHQLLTHTAGLPDAVGPDFQVMPRDSLVRRALASDLLWEPGTRYRYSNVGYSLLGAIIEIASGQPYERYVHERLFRPAGMTKTGYVIPEWRDGEIAHGYASGRDWGTPLERPWAEDGPWWNLRGNGGMLSTVHDLYRWHIALEEGRVLSDASRKEAQTPQVPENEEGTSYYGYGWAIFPLSGGKRLIAHNGGNGAFFADLRRYVDDDVVLVLTANQENRHTLHVWRQVVRRTFGKEWEPYVPKERITVDPALFGAYEGVFEISPELRLTVTREGDRLFLQAPDAPPYQLFAESEVRYFAEEIPGVIFEFVRSEGGAVGRLIIRDGDEETPARRVQQLR